MEIAGPACPSCGAVIAGRYCEQCGERRLRSHDYSIRHHLEEMFEIFTHLDSKIVRSLWRLLSQPGALSADYLRGRRVKFMSPLRLFVVVSVVYFLSLTLLHAIPFKVAPSIQFNTFATPLATQLHGNDFYPALAARLVQRKLQHGSVGYDELERRYDRQTVVYSKTLLFMLIPVFAGLLALLFIRKRRYLSEHVVIATHFWSFALLLIGVLLPLAIVPVIYLADAAGLRTGAVINDYVVSYALQAVLGVYLFLMLRRAYGASGWYSALVASAIAWSFFFIVWLFRFFLFTATLLSI